MADFTFTQHSNLVILNPVTLGAIDWCDEHLPDDAQRWGANGYVIEARYFADIYHGIQNDGLTFDR